MQAVAREVPMTGRVLDIGYHGVLAEISRPVSQFSEVVLEFDLPLVGKRLRDLYGKVVKVVPHAAHPLQLRARDRPHRDRRHPHQQVGQVHAPLPARLDLRRPRRRGQASRT
mgnify:CR=1 FL=1